MTEFELFTAALARPDPADRDAYLVAACGRDGPLRRRVDRLLALHAADNPVLDCPPVDLLASLIRTAEPTPCPTAEAVERLAPYLGPAGRDGGVGRLGRYELLAVLGRGGYGVVFRAVDTTLDRVVAVKVLDPALAATSPPRKRFLREARAAARVRHDHVVRVYAVEEQPLPYLVMEYVEGQTLQQRLDATGPFDPLEVAALGRQIALGLAAAHAQGLVHRDVKPANILLEAGPEPRVRLTDFGLARTADDASQTQSGVVAGTPLFMAPEQVQGQAIDPRTDLFSLGGVLYTMAAGHPPFRAANTFAILKRVAEAAPRPLPEVIPDLPPGLVAVIHRLLARRPDDRHPTAQAAADALATCLDAPPRRRRVAQVGAAAAVGLLAVAGLVWAAATRPVPTDPPTGPTVASAPTTPSAATVTAPTAEERFRAVAAALKARNPDLDESLLRPITRDGELIGLVCPAANPGRLADLSPLAGAEWLQELRLYACGVTDLSPLRGSRLTFFESHHNPITDLSPLAGVPLRHLVVWGSQVSDLSPLRGMPLELLNCGDSPVTDLSPLAGSRLTSLCLNLSRVADLSPLKGVPLRELVCENTPVTDISPLAGLPLEAVWLYGAPVADWSPLRSLPRLKHVGLEYDPARHADLVRSLPTLETINRRPVAEVLNPPPLVVTRPEDDGRPGTLRWAVAEANARPGADAITFDPAAFAARTTITLTAGPLALLDPARTTVTGPAAGLTVSGGGKDKVFVVGAGTRPAAARLVGLTVADGKATEQNQLGGGVLCQTGSTVDLVGCTLRDNAAPQDGGGGLYNYNGTVSLTNCTVARNTGREGGGVKNYGGDARLSLVHCTFAGNSAGIGGGVFSHGSGRTEVYNSLFGGNSGGDLSNGDGSTVGDHNVTGDDSAPGPNSRSYLDPKLGKLGNHGGPTETVPPLADSPAVGAGDPARVPAGVTTDQRGRPRVTDGRVDAGACQGQ